MVTHEVAITIYRPIQEVFAYVSDFQKSLEWQSGLVESKRISEGAQGVGAQYVGARNFMGRKLESTIELTSFEQDKQFAYKSIAGSTHFHQSFSFEPADGGTRVSSSIEMETGGLLGLAKPLILSSLKHDMGADFETLKKRLEARMPEAAA
jgi:uncharacterized membrane protein